MAQSPDPVKIAANAITQALQTGGYSSGGYVDDREVGGWASNVSAALEKLRPLVSNYPEAVMLACESALVELIDASEFVHDSDGQLTDLADELEALHLHACERAKPDPEALAGRMFAIQLHGDLDAFENAREVYAEVLGREGMAELDRLNEEFEQSLLEPSGESVAPEYAWEYAGIAEKHLANGRHEQALHWAEAGMRAFPDKPDSALREIAANEYHRLNRHDEAMDLIWTEFCRRGDLSGYTTLSHHAIVSGSWPEWQERALIHLRERIAKERAEAEWKKRPFWAAPLDHSTLVEIFLFEKDLDSAWREAQLGGCSGRLWLRLAAAMEAVQPDDAADVYLLQADSTINKTDNGRYEESVKLLIKAAELMHRAGRGTEFAQTLAVLEKRYKFKRNFIKELNRNRARLTGSPY